MRMLFLNLPVKDLEASKAFFAELGSQFNPRYSDQQAACMIVDGNILVMLLVEERFRDFINGEIADATTTEAITCLSAESREQIDDLVAVSGRRSAPPPRRRGAAWYACGPR